MKDNTAIHPLAQPNEKSGRVKFIHFRDGKEHTFSTCVNKMTGSRLAWFDNNAPQVGNDESLTYVKTVFRDIFKKSPKIIEVIGDFKPQEDGYHKGCKNCGASFDEGCECVKE